MQRKRSEWKIRNQSIQLGDRTIVMGILNVTPDSFSDGGQFLDPDRAVARALEMEEQGADIIDIGAESTRPGSTRISEEEEVHRLVPVLKRLRNKLSIPISVDTYKSSVAARAFELGASIVNDPSGLTFDAKIAKTAAEANAGLVINHMRGAPESWAKLPPFRDPAGGVTTDLKAAAHRAQRSGVPRQQIVLDPGLGFGKRKEENSEIIAHLSRISQEVDFPILIGPSRKSFLRQETDEDTEFATAAAIAACILSGAHIVRVHDVRRARIAVKLADEIARF